MSTPDTTRRQIMAHPFSCPLPRPGERVFFMHPLRAGTIPDMHGGAARHDGEHASGASRGTLRPLGHAGVNDTHQTHGGRR